MLFLEEDIVVGIDFDVGVGIFLDRHVFVVGLVDEADADADGEHQDRRYAEANLESVLHEIPPS